MTDITPQPTESFIHYSQDISEPSSVSTHQGESTQKLQILINHLDQNNSIDTINQDDTFDKQDFKSVVQALIDGGYELMIKNMLHEKEMNDMKNLHQLSPMKMSPVKLSPMKVQPQTQKSGSNSPQSFVPSHDSLHSPLRPLGVPRDENRDSDESVSSRASSIQPIKVIDLPVSSPPTSRDGPSLREVQMQKQVEEMKEMNRRLEFKLEESRKYNRELLNEMKYRDITGSNSGDKCGDVSGGSGGGAAAGGAASATSTGTAAGTATGTGTGPTTGLTTAPTTAPTTATRSTTTTTGTNTDPNLLTINTIDPSYKHYFTKLNLDKIDNLSKTKLSNTLKNMLLKLMINYDELQIQTDRSVKMTKLVLSFIDDLHREIYPESPCPLIYFDENQTDSDINLALCLDELTRVLGFKSNV